MKLRVERVDLDRTRASWPEGLPFAPALVTPVEKIGGSKWIVLSAPLTPGDDPAWAYADNDEYLRIPLFSYDLNPAADLAMAFMLQLGLSCAARLPGKISQFFVVTGNPVALLYDSDTDINTGIRYWVGFAVMLS
jgi:hypothetical protein